MNDSKKKGDRGSAPSPDRRGFLLALGGMAAGAVLSRVEAQGRPQPVLRRIPSSGEMLSAVGMGSWLTFDVGNDVSARAARQDVLQAFFACGGRLIDSSPMYGTSEEVLGSLLPRVLHLGLFAATKVWTSGRQSGINQMGVSRRLWGVERFDLIQIHNMLDWETHLETLRAWKGEGRVRYVGITTSHGRRHDDLEKALARHRFDFVQFTYNVGDREVERRLLPLAADRGTAVIINRPFDGGDLFRKVRGKPLPSWAADIDCRSWAEYFLKFIVSHPAVTCAIPATTRVDHMQENMRALYGPLPDARLRERMAEYFRSL